jgi:hypothetical protein
MGAWRASPIRKLARRHGVGRSAGRQATRCSAKTSADLRRRQGLTEEAANSAIDQACRRLRLPTIRAG